MQSPLLVCPCIRYALYGFATLPRIPTEHYGKGFKYRFSHCTLRSLGPHYEATNNQTRAQHLDDDPAHRLGAQNELERRG